MRAVRNSTAFVCLVSLLLSSAGPALAGETEADRKRRAKAFVEEGNRKYDLAKYDEAIELYERAYEIWPYPETLFNLCQAFRLKKDFEKAVFYCKSYLRNSPDAENAAEVAKRIQEMEDGLAAAKSTAEKPPRDVRPPTEQPFNAASVSNHSMTHRLDVQPWYADWAGWALVAAGVSVSVFGGLGVATADDLRARGDQAATPERQQALYDDAELRQNLGWVGVAAGAGLVVVGAIKLGLTDAAGDDQSSLAFWSSSSAIRLVWTTSF